MTVGEVLPTSGPVVTWGLQRRLNTDGHRHQRLPG